MSGKRQHFVPRFLQEGFASHRNGDESYTWVYRKKTAPFNSNIINVGVEGRFYTEPGDSTADDLITSAETSFSALVRGLRSGQSSSLSDPQIPELIAHLEVRTRHLRENFLQTGEFLVSKLLEFLSDEKAAESFLIRRFQNDPSMFRDSFAEELTKRGIPKEWHHVATQVGMALMPRVEVAPLV